MSLLLDSEPEIAEADRVLGGFDGSNALALCEIAAVMCGAPIAGVRLLEAVGEQREVWHGRPVRSISLDQTPCSLVIETGEPLVISDLRAHLRPDGEAWSAGGLRAYAGVPILTRIGETLGSVCVLDDEPRDFSDAQVRGLRTLASQVAGGLELLRLAVRASESARERDAAKARERRSRGYLEAVVEGLGDGILLVDEGNRTLLLNSAFCRMMELAETPAELHGDPRDLARKVLAASERSPLGCLAGLFTTADADLTRQARELRLPNGSILELGHAPLALKGEAQARLWQFRDVTERRRAESEAARSVERFHALVEASPLAIFAMDPSGRPDFVSDGCAVLFGMAGTRYDETAWIAALHEEDHDRAIAKWAEAMRTQTSLDVQYRIYDAEGDIQELVVRAAAMHASTGEFSGWVGTITDVTEQADINRALAHSRRASEQARADLAVRNEELSSLARTRDAVLAAISHEFRTPLTSITTFLELLEAEDGLTVAQRKAVAVIARNTARLEHLVSDLLSAKQETADIEVELEAVDLDQAVKEAIGAAILRARECEVELVALEPDAAAGEEVRALADPKRVAQVLDSLLDNALKFTPAGGRIEVRSRRVGRCAEIEVADSGVGIAVEELGRIFDSFYQGTAGRQSGRGSGLGLAIIHRILEAQDATIDVRSLQGAGTTMTISFPLHTAR